jgi:hypothetical protein
MAPEQLTCGEWRAMKQRDKPFSLAFRSTIACPHGLTLRRTPASQRNPRRIKKAPGPERDPRGAEDNALWDREPVVGCVAETRPPASEVIRRSGSVGSTASLPSARRTLRQRPFDITCGPIQSVVTGIHVLSAATQSDRMDSIESRCRIAPAGRFVAAASAGGPVPCRDGRKIRAALRSGQGGSTASRKIVS